MPTSALGPSVLLAVPPVRVKNQRPESAVDLAAVVAQATASAGYVLTVA